MTQSLTHLDVIIGFSTGDVIWFDPMSNKYARINKNVLKSEILHSFDYADIVKTVRVK